MAPPDCQQHHALGACCVCLLPHGAATIWVSAFGAPTAPAKCCQDFFLGSRSISPEWWVTAGSLIWALRERGERRYADMDICRRAFKSRGMGWDKHMHGDARLWDPTSDFLLAPWVIMSRFQHRSQMARAITYPRAGLPLHLQLPPVSTWVFIHFPIAASPFCLFSPTTSVDLTPAVFGGAAFGEEAAPRGQRWVFSSSCLRRERDCWFLSVAEHHSQGKLLTCSPWLLFIPSHSNYAAAFWPSFVLSCCVSSEFLLALPSLKRSDCKISQGSFPFPGDQETSWLLNQAP